MNRRAFFRRTFGAMLVAAVAAPLVPLKPPTPGGGILAAVAATPELGAVGGIDRATFTFWRNQQATVGAYSGLLLTDRPALEAYEKLLDGKKTTDVAER